MDTQKSTAGPAADRQPDAPYPPIPVPPQYVFPLVTRGKTVAKDGEPGTDDAAGCCGGGCCG